MRFLRKLLGETDAVDEAAREAGSNVHEGQIEAPEAPTMADEPADLPEPQRDGEDLSSS
jgi:hypothetical protein